MIDFGSNCLDLCPQYTVLMLDWWWLKPWTTKDNQNLFSAKKVFQLTKHKILRFRSGRDPNCLSHREKKAWWFSWALTHLSIVLEAHVLNGMKQKGWPLHSLKLRYHLNIDIWKPTFLFVHQLFGVQYNTQGTSTFKRQLIYCLLMLKINSKLYPPWTNIAPKNGWLELGPRLFSGALAVSFREGTCFFGSCILRLLGWLDLTRSGTKILSQLSLIWHEDMQG